jgi:hypothetical protein
MRNLERTVRFHPYRKGDGPSFTLRLYSTGLTGEYGKNRIAYRLISSETGVLFDGDDLQCHSYADENETVECIMTFLTLQPGDTDPEYFKDYTDAQREFAAQHAEALGCEVDHRFRCHECGSALDEDYSCRTHGKRNRRKDALPDGAMTSAVHSHTTTGFCPVCIKPGGGCSFAGG